QGPAVKLILKHKSELIDCLRADPSFILQHTHARNIVTDREYQNLKCINQPEEAVIKLIDKVIDKGQEYCSAFNELLREVLLPGLQSLIPLGASFLQLSKNTYETDSSNKSAPPLIDPRSGCVRFTPPDTAQMQTRSYPACLPHSSAHPGRHLPVP
uniref:CARD domain-containing protein n=1 Tax=Echeneis naucrates TaxID=173247 RepID=A0A665VFH3_ECHNA